MEHSKKNNGKKKGKFSKIHYFWIAGVILVALAFASYYAFPVGNVEFKVGEKIAPNNIEYIVKNISETRTLTISCKNVSSSPQNVTALFWLTDYEGKRFDPVGYKPGTTFSDNLQPGNSGIIDLNFDTPTILTEENMQYALHIKDGKEVIVPLK